MLNKRLSDLSSNEEEYKKAKPLHETALNESGYKTTVTCTIIITSNNGNRTIILYGLTCFIIEMFKPTSEKHSSS